MKILFYDDYGSITQFGPLNFFLGSSYQVVNTPDYFENCDDYLVKARGEKGVESVWSRYDDCAAFDPEKK